MVQQQGVCVTEYQFSYKQFWQRSIQVEQAIPTDWVEAITFLFFLAQYFVILKSSKFCMPCGSSHEGAPCISIAFKSVLFGSGGMAPYVLPA